MDDDVSSAWRAIEGVGSATGSRGPITWRRDDRVLSDSRSGDVPTPDLPTNRRAIDGPAATHWRRSPAFSDRDDRCSSDVLGATTSWPGRIERLLPVGHYHYHLE